MSKPDRPTDDRAVDLGIASQVYVGVLSVNAAVQAEAIPGGEREKVRLRPVTQGNERGVTFCDDL